MFNDSRFYLRAVANNANFSATFPRDCGVFFLAFTYTIALVLGGFWP